MIEIDADDPRQKPYIISFDNGEVARVAATRHATLLHVATRRTTLQRSTPRCNAGPPLLYYYCTTVPHVAMQVHHYCTKSLKKLTVFLVPYDDQLIIQDRRETLSPTAANRRSAHERTC